MDTTIGKLEGNIVALRIEKSELTGDNEKLQAELEEEIDVITSKYNGYIEKLTFSLAGKDSKKKEEINFKINKLEYNRNSDIKQKKALYLGKIKANNITIKDIESKINTYRSALKLKEKEQISNQPSPKKTKKPLVSTTEKKESKLDFAVLIYKTHKKLNTIVKKDDSKEYEGIFPYSNEVLNEVQIDVVDPKAITTFGSFENWVTQYFAEVRMYEKVITKLDDDAKTKLGKVISKRSENFQKLFEDFIFGKKVTHPISKNRWRNLETIERRVLILNYLYSSKYIMKKTAPIILRIFKQLADKLESSTSEIKDLKKADLKTIFSPIGISYNSMKSLISFNSAIVGFKNNDREMTVISKNGLKYKYINIDTSGIANEYVFIPYNFKNVYDVPPKKEINVVKTVDVVIKETSLDVFSDSVKVLRNLVKNTKKTEHSTFKNEDYLAFMIIHGKTDETPTYMFVLANMSKFSTVKETLNMDGLYTYIFAPGSTSHIRIESNGANLYIGSSQQTLISDFGKGLVVDVRELKYINMFNKLSADILKGKYTYDKVHEVFISDDEKSKVSEDYLNNRSMYIYKRLEYQSGGVRMDDFNKIIENHHNLPEDVASELAMLIYLFKFQNTYGAFWLKSSIVVWYSPAHKNLYDENSGESMNDK